LPKFTHNNLNEKDRVENEAFNKSWISEKQVIDYDLVNLSELRVSEHDKRDSSPFHVVWLKNIDRLMGILSKSDCYEDFTFVDVGCGSGISTLYTADNYPFKRFIGFDFDSELIKSAKINSDLFEIDKTLLTFTQGNARDYILPHERCVVFMFNPFGLETLKVFIENNLSLLKETSSIVAYANDLFIDYLDSLNVDIKRDDKFNLSLIRF
jgi:SAM-dependent methyltransferase